MAATNGSAGAFFHRLIDYAGLFPPAALGVSEAVTNYRTYLDSPDRSMLGRFIGTTPHVVGLTEEQVALFSPEAPLDISLVSRDPVGDMPKVIEKVQSCGGRVSIGAVEVALPVTENFKAALIRIEAAALSLDRPENKVPIFCELGGGEGWDHALPTLIGTIAEARRGGRVCGLKLRCGGLEPQLVPSPERVAAALKAAAEADIPVKCTAGLHHPFRRPQASLFPPMHGYFNIFFAAFVAYLRRPSTSELGSIIAEMERCDPVLGRDGIEWLGIKLSTDEIVSARERFALSYGSCSFVEPIDDARTLHWL